MAETPMAPDIAEPLKTTAAFFSNVFAPDVSPLLKAQADLLAGTETTVSDWLHRRYDAAVDTQQVILRLCTISNPFEALKMQQEWVSRALLRFAADTAAYQSAAEQLMDRTRTWLPKGEEKVRSKSPEGIASADARRDRPRAAAASIRSMRVARAG
jgi:hypothetical protein